MMSRDITRASVRTTGEQGPWLNLSVRAGCGNGKRSRGRSTRTLQKDAPKCYMNYDVCSSGIPCHHKNDAYRDHNKGQHLLHTH